MKPKPHVGQKLFSLNIGYSTRSVPQVLTPVTVTKVGRKYFTVKSDGFSFETEYHLDTWLERTDYAQNTALYESKQEWLDEKEKERIWRFLHDTFSYGGAGNKLSLDHLRWIEKSITNP